MSLGLMSVYLHRVSHEILMVKKQTALCLLFLDRSDVCLILFYEAKVVQEFKSSSVKKMTEDHP